VIKTVRREGRDLGDERMVGVKQETKITSGGTGEDWGGGEKEGSVWDFRELDRSVDNHEFSLGWVNGEVRRHPVGNVREKRTEIVGCRFEGFRRRRERYVKLSIVSIEVVIVSAREWIYEWAEGGSIQIEENWTKDRSLGDARSKGQRRGWETRCSDYEGTRSEISGEPVKCDASDAEPSRESVE
jgi:hypothetical protein